MFPVKTLSLHYHELMGKTKENMKEKKYLVRDDKEIIGTENFTILKY